MGKYGPPITFGVGAAFSLSALVMVISLAPSEVMESAQREPLILGDR
jgi:hypothetical protein